MRADGATADGRGRPRAARCRSPSLWSGRTTRRRPSRTAPWNSAVARCAASSDWNVASAKPLDWPLPLRLTSQATTEPMPPSRAKSASDVIVQLRLPTNNVGLLLACSSSA